MKTVGDWLKNNVEGDKKKPDSNGSQPKQSHRPPRKGRGNSRLPGRQAGNRKRGAHKTTRTSSSHPRPQQSAASGRGDRRSAQAQPAKPMSRNGNGVRVYPLGGFEQVGRNCFVIEVGQDIYIIDLGLQFPDEDMLGIDYLVPDISCLKGKENRIKAILFTHGHLDHIGAVQHLLPQLHFPPCYGTKLTMAFVKKRLDEEKLTSKATLHNVHYGERIRLGSVEVEFIKVTHSIPDSAAIAVHTPSGTILHTGDFKFDFTPSGDVPADFQRFAQLGKEGVEAIIADSTNATKSGMSPSEADISNTLYELIRNAKGRVIISTFSSLLSRIQMVADHAKTFNRKMFIAGRSMTTNVEIAQNLGYLKAPRGLIRKVGPGMDKLPDKEVLIVTTGSQGEEQAGLARIGLGTHRHITVKKGDTVILSSNPIIGNERAVAKVINNLHLKGAVVKTNTDLALHVTGHGHKNDLLLMHRLVQARHVIPEHGEPHMRTAHADIVKSIGYEDNRVHLLSNGEILDFDGRGGARKSKQKIEIGDVIIDGRGAAGEGQRVLTDRKIMSRGGIVMVVLRAYQKSGRLVGMPDIIARGLIYGSEQAQITKEVAETAKKAYDEAMNRGDRDRKELKRAVNGSLYRYFDRKLNREPMVVPVIVEV